MKLHYVNQTVIVFVILSCGLLAVTSENMLFRACNVFAVAVWSAMLILNQYEYREHVKRLAEIRAETARIEAETAEIIRSHQEFLETLRNV